MAVAQAAWALGPDAIKKQFIPDHPDVLFHTPLVNPHESATLYFKAPEKEGDYPYVCTMPGHAALMNGTMKVSAGAIDKAPDLLRDIEYRYYQRHRRADFAALENTHADQQRKNVRQTVLARSAQRRVPVCHRLQRACSQSPRMAITPSAFQRRAAPSCWSIHSPSQ